MAALLNGFAQDFTSVAEIMAENLLKTGNFFFLYDTISILYQCRNTALTRTLIFPFNWLSMGRYTATEVAKKARFRDQIGNLFPDLYKLGGDW